MSFRGTIFCELLRKQIGSFGTSDGTYLETIQELIPKINKISIVTPLNV